jgi:tetratricopeptide (TPR) repeat protein
MNKQLTTIPLCILAIACTQSQLQPSLAIGSTQVQNVNYKATSAGRNKYTGVVKQVDDIAQQITVRIENSQGNGSGVIIARQGNTYYVATAAHVVNGQGYSIITPTQERVTVRQIIIPEQETDVAIVKFQSSQNYQLAKIGNARFKQGFNRVFVSGFPGRDPSKTRYLSIGSTYADRNGNNFNDFWAKDSSNLDRGYDLLYTNLSLRGMSGGAVLDTQGRLVGINTAAENEAEIINDRYIEINSGHALGVSISTLLRVVKTALPSLSSDLTPALALTSVQEAEIKQNLLVTLSSPSRTATANEWLDYGNLLWRSDRTKESVAAFDRAIGLLRSTPTPDRDQLKLAYYGRGLALGSGQSKQEQLAVIAFQQATKVDPTFMPAWRSLAGHLVVLNRNIEALKAIEVAIELKPNNSSLYMIKGMILQSLKRYSEAIVATDRFIKDRPNNTSAYHQRGNLYVKQKKYPQALADYNKAIQIDPQDISAYINRGILYVKQKYYTQALIEYNKTIQIDPRDTFAYNQRGNLYRLQKKHPQALADFNKVIQLDPQDTYAYINRGQLYQLQKQYPQALTDFSKAIQLDPQKPSGYINRGNIHSLQNKYFQARADYNKAIQLDPQNADAYISRAVLIGGIDDFNKAIKIDSQNADTYIKRGIYYRDKNAQYPEALADFNKAIQLDPQNADAYINRGKIYRHARQFPQALADFNKAIQVDPQNADTYINRGNFYRLQIELQQRRLGSSYTKNNQQDSQVLADYAKALQLDPQNIDAYNSRGSFYSLQKQYSQTLIDYTKVIQLDPKTADSYFNRGDIYRLQKQYPQALIDYTKAIALEDRFDEAYIKRGHVYYEMGDRDKAIKDWQKSIVLGNDTLRTSELLALAVALFTQGKKAQAYASAERALAVSRDIDIQSLKEQNWGDQLLTDTQKLMNDPKIKALVIRNSNP